MKRTIVVIASALVLWTVMFSPLTAPYIDFWLMMTLSALLLGSLVTLFRPSWPRDMKWSAANVALGVALAAALWGVFWIGDKLSGVLFDFARGQVDTIYGIKEGISPWLLSALLLLLIGPAEEIVWRGYVQRSLSQWWGPNAGFAVATALYAAVHIPSLNFMLVMAALVAGTVWGAAYRFFPDRFTAIVVSHALWDAAVFVWWPI